MRACPFRGSPPLRAKQRFNEQRFRKKMFAQRTQKHGWKGFGFMLRHWCSGKDYGWQPSPREYWIVAREGWPARTFMHPQKRPNLAQQRKLDTELPF